MRAILLILVFPAHVMLMHICVLLLLFPLLRANNSSFLPQVRHDTQMRLALLLLVPVLHVLSGLIIVRQIAYVCFPLY